MSQLFADLGLSAAVTRAVAEQGYTQPTPVQQQSIPVILAGRDVLAGAQTGTGKTAGFTLPLLQLLASGANARPPRKAVRALILAPTRELAAQVEESVRTYGKYVSLQSALVYGGVGINPQIEALRRGVDILVATPGRLLDHVQQKTVDLSRVEILVLDEADRMLDMGFIHDIRRILALLPPRRQNLLFSATFSDEIRRLADGLLREPVSVEVARRNADADLVTQRIHPVAQDRKRELLIRLVKDGDWRQVLVFSRTKHGANRLAEQLARAGVEATAIHGNKSQNARTRALADFKAGAVRVLVATDIAARGLDIAELPHVVNFDLPHVAEDYVHRIGRTGRAGCSGEALSLVSPDEQPLLAAIEKLLGRRLERQAIPGFEPAAGGSRPAAQNMPRDRSQQHRGRRHESGDRREPARSGAESERNRHNTRRDDPQRTRDERQPASNAGQLFPSSARTFGEPRRAARPRHRSGPVPAVLNSGNRRTG